MPRHHLTGRNILDHRKIRIHAIEWQIGDVGAEYCTWYGLIECPLELVGECPVLQSFLHNRFVWVSSSYFGEKIVLSHDSLYFLVIHLWESHFDASPAIFSFAFIEDFFDEKVVRVVLVRFI